MAFGVELPEIAARFNQYARNRARGRPRTPPPMTKHRPSPDLESPSISDATSFNDEVTPVSLLTELDVLDPALFARVVLLVQFVDLVDAEAWPAAEQLLQRGAAPPAMLFPDDFTRCCELVMERMPTYTVTSWRTTRSAER